MLQAMNTGHDGSLTTLHANSPRDAISRLEMMARYAVDLPVEILERQIASALDIIIHLERDAAGVRRVVEVDHVAEGGEGVVLEPCCTWNHRDHGYEWTVPTWLDLVMTKIEGVEGEVRRWMESL